VRSWIASGRLKVKKVNMGVRYVQLEEVDALWLVERAKETDAVKKAKRRERKAKTG
jgi:hypothetical protein